MTDLERRLRDAMMGAVEPPPSDLVEHVLRRHRRHRRRVVAGCAAMAAAIALSVGPVAHALRTGLSPSGPAASASMSPEPAASSVTAAPGTVLDGCGNANVGQVAAGNLPLDWRRTGGAGPLRVLDVGGHGTVSLQGEHGATGTAGPAALYVVAVVITRIHPGAAVVLKVTTAGQHDVRFLFGPADSMNPGTVYTMRSGEPGVTFVMCPQGSAADSGGPITTYYGGMLITGTRCVPAEEWAPGRARPIRLDLGACR